MQFVRYMRPKASKGSTRDSPHVLLVAFLQMPLYWYIAPIYLLSNDNCKDSDGLTCSTCEKKIIGVMVDTSL